MRDDDERLIAAGITSREGWYGLPRLIWLRAHFV
jgi:hypothetical protein